MQNVKGRFIGAVALAGLACATPTGLCGCPPARMAVMVSGTVTDSSGTPVAGARIFLAGFPEDRPATVIDELSGPADALTDAGGVFLGRAYSYFGLGPQELRVAVVRAGASDTVRLSAGRAPFRLEGERLDTARVTLRLP